mmetsp:Transcript_41435/g.47097  ORF Transcript_41435/g.47097 Transcript_41435/m.47097 type:complete len:101 (+) Transcript_41435:39-341(+)
MHCCCCACHCCQCCKGCHCGNCCRGCGCRNCGCNCDTPCCGLGILLCPAAIAAFAYREKQRRDRSADSKAEPLTNQTMEDREVPEKAGSDKTESDSENKV